MPRLLLLGDPHVGFRQYGLDERTVDFASAFERACAEALRLSPDAVCVMGDLFETPKPSLESVKLARDLFDSLKSAGVRVLGVGGNHDRAAGGGRGWLWVCGAEELTPDAVATVRSADGGEVTLCGLPHGTALPAELPECDVVALHLAVEGLCGMAKPEATRQYLAGHGFKLAACGHIHTAFDSAHDGLRLLCPGSLEVTDADEPVPKKMALVTFDQGFPRKVEWVDLKTRRFARVDIPDEASLRLLGSSDLSGALVLATLPAGVPDGARRARELLDGAGALARITIRSAGAWAGSTSWNRGGAEADLRSVVRATMEGAADDERELVLALLDSPDRTMDLAKEFVDRRVGAA